MLNKINKNKNYNMQKENLIPAIIQHAISGEVLMLGYMNKKSIEITKKTGYVTFFSRSKNRLWTKGEVSGNLLKLVNFYDDCDLDTLLILAIPYGPTCHLGHSSCFNSAFNSVNFLYKLEQIIYKKINNFTNNNEQSSYTLKLYHQGIKRIAQKVGEESIETIIAALSNNNNTDELINEGADLIYHLLVLLQHKNLNFNKIIEKLYERHNIKKNKNKNYK